jgi:hypothetical protein
MCGGPLKNVVDNSDTSSEDPPSKKLMLINSCSCQEVTLRYPTVNNTKNNAPFQSSLQRSVCPASHGSYTETVVPGQNEETEK